MDAWGHTLTALIGDFPPEAVQPSNTLVDFARMLNKHYIPTSTPNGFDMGAPTDFYTDEEAQNAIRYAAALLDFSRDQIK